MNRFVLQCTVYAIIFIIIATVSGLLSLYSLADIIQ